MRQIQVTVFISYRHKDTRNFALLLRTALIHHVGAGKIFHDSGIEPGELWRKRIKDGLKASTVLLPLIGPNWMAMLDKRRFASEDLLVDEIEHGLNAELHVVPVLVDKARMPAAAQLPARIQRLPDLQAISMGWRGFDRDLERLLRVLGAPDVAQLQAPAPPRLVRLMSEWRLSEWKYDDFIQGLTSGACANTLPPEQGEPIDLAMLRDGRLSLQDDFDRLGTAFDAWAVAATSRKRGGEHRLRMFWVEGSDHAKRARARLACLARTQAAGRRVFDAGRDLATAVQGLEGTAVPRYFPIPPLITANLDSSAGLRDWRGLERVLVALRLHPERDDRDRLPRLLVAGTALQKQQASNALKALVEITVHDVKGIPGTRPYSFAGLYKLASKTVSRRNVYNRGLPATAQTLYGREADLKRLDRSWSSEHTRILSVLAYGGMGKSALVNTWLERMRDDDYRGARKVFAWSFYSQGTKENLVSADPFVRAAIRWLGDSAPLSINQWTNGERLAALIRRHRMLLVLDGLEPLQYLPKSPETEGGIKDASIKALLEGLAAPGWHGLCLVTTRVPLAIVTTGDLGGSRRTHDVETLDLDPLSVGAAAELLVSLIGPGEDRLDVHDAVKDVGCHALAVTLLGKYLRQVHGGDLRQRFELAKRIHKIDEGGHARRIMESYVRWLTDSHRLLELDVLNMIGLFDRPVEEGAMDALLAESSVRLFSTAHGQFRTDAWDHAIAELRSMGLLNSAIPDGQGVIDAHPLVREHFLAKLRDKGGNAWKQANATLFRYYGEKVIMKQPETEKEMTDLYASVTYGCSAGLYQRVYDEVLLPRIWRERRDSFSTRKLAMTGSDLAALFDFFEHPWTTLRNRVLNRRARVLVLTNTAVRLRQLGRLYESRSSFAAVVGEVEAGRPGRAELEDASYAAFALGELQVVAGCLDIDRSATHEPGTALVSCQRALRYADRSGHPYFRMHARSSLAEVHFMLGNDERARVLFDEALAIDRDEGPQPPFHYSQSLFRLGYYLIEVGRPEEFLATESTVHEWGYWIAANGKDESSLLSTAIRQMMRGAARRAVLESTSRKRGDFNEAVKLVNESVNDFRRAGYADYLVRGLTERAHVLRLRRATGDDHRAMEDLDRAARLAGHGQMNLLYADVLLERAACYVLGWPETLREHKARKAARDTIREADNLVREINYGRRRPMVAQLVRAARDRGVDV